MGRSEGMYYDRQYNLLYIFVYANETQKAGLLSKSTKSVTNYNQVSNIILWDVPKQTKSRLFDEDELNGEYIRQLTFEQHYSKENHCIVFNHNQAIWNNVEVFEREIRDKLLIETYHPEKEEVYLWISDKWGFDKRKVATLPKSAKWHLDVWNSVIRIVERQKDDVDIRGIDW